MKSVITLPILRDRAAITSVPPLAQPSRTSVMLPRAEARRLLRLGIHQQVPTEQQLNSYNNWKDNLYTHRSMTPTELTH